MIDWLIVWLLCPIFAHVTLRESMTLKLNLDVLIHQNEVTSQDFEKLAREQHRQTYTHRERETDTDRQMRPNALPQSHSWVQSASFTASERGCSTHRGVWLRNTILEVWFIRRFRCGVCGAPPRLGYSLARQSTFVPPTGCSMPQTSRSLGRSRWCGVWHFSRTMTEGSDLDEFNPLNASWSKLLLFKAFIRALWCSVVSARMSKIKNGWFDQYDKRFNNRLSQPRDV